MRNAVLFVALLACLSGSAAMAADPIPPYLEAWCDGGIDGRYQHVTVEPDGRIRGTNEREAAKPWPEVARDADAASRWFSAVESAEPKGPNEFPPPAAPDQIYCGLELNKGQESVLYDLPEILQEIVIYAPKYH
jgi:hypothetical protein